MLVSLCSAENASRFWITVLLILAGALQRTKVKPKYRLNGNE